MADESKLLYRPGMSPRKLAEAVLADSYEEEMPSIPIDPFKLMREYKIIYQFMGFEDLEGIYLVPENKDDIAVVGINYKRPITRQRFTAAHELCHHLKDRKNEACPIDGRNEIERYAEKFAAELLMPFSIFKATAKEYAVSGKWKSIVGEALSFVRNSMRGFSHFRAGNINVYEYLKFLLEHRPSKEMTDEQCADLAPWSEKLQSIKNHM